MEGKLTSWEPVNESDLLDPWIGRNGRDPKTASWIIVHSLALFKKKSKAILIIGYGGPQGCEWSQLLHFIGNWLTDGGEFVSLMSLLHFLPQKNSWYSFLLEAESTPRS
jgi:hypothetical protein